VTEDSHEKPQCVARHTIELALLTTIFTLVWLIPRTWRWRHHVSPNRLLTFNRLHGVISQKKDFFILFKLLHPQVWTSELKIISNSIFTLDRLCGLVVRVHGYTSRGPGFDSRRCQMFWEVVGLERGPHSLLRIIEQLLEWKSSGSGLETRINDRGDPLRWQHDTLYLKKLALTSATSGGRSVGIVRLRTNGHGVFSLYFCCYFLFVEKILLIPLKTLNWEVEIRNLYCQAYDSSKSNICRWKWRWIGGWGIMVTEARAVPSESSDSSFHRKAR
jgi:hypothetical protein